MLPQQVKNVLKFGLLIFFYFLTLNTRKDSSVPIGWSLRHLISSIRCVRWLAWKPCFRLPFANWSPRIDAFDHAYNKCTLQSLQRKTSSMGEIIAISRPTLALV